MALRFLKTSMHFHSHPTTHHNRRTIKISKNKVDFQTDKQPQIFRASRCSLSERSRGRIAFTHSRLFYFTFGCMSAVQLLKYLWKFRTQQINKFFFFTLVTSPKLGWVLRQWSDINRRIITSFSFENIFFASALRKIFLDVVVKKTNKFNVAKFLGQNIQNVSLNCLWCAMVRCWQIKTSHKYTLN